MKKILVLILVVIFTSFKPTNEALLQAYLVSNDVDTSGNFTNWRSSSVLIRFNAQRMQIMSSPALILYINSSRINNQNILFFSGRDSDGDDYTARIVPLGGQGMVQLEVYYSWTSFSYKLRTL